MNEYNIYSDSFRHARQLFKFIEGLIDGSIKVDKVKKIRRNDYWSLEIGDEKFTFRPYARIN